MAAMNPAAAVVWVILLGLPIGFAFLALSRLSSPPAATGGDLDTNEQRGPRS
ncbi:hypothetical protein [Methylobacterium haplocladii]|uniref:Cbb3-type cytochrome oxidase assembly protein CcoS n=1 Tax=Methylobacterium haplocladii TaxID=1176176 RepID=A0A512IS86_9HYPH|nr:hypothetical protein [Methylobacterium haplocladii]GEP00575.1 hypothetical protein MHA02_29620 [Methylobacterium haplocladii]GJD85490.1 hypothetical protein HPGCJGGD_3379 [Methylobacterium haplocladii]GLS57723.1 hypothetical protein GCM10007887_03790 [Methylobacterium haplocladii]